MPFKYKSQCDTLVRILHCPLSLKMLICEKMKVLQFKLLLTLMGLRTKQYHNEGQMTMILYETTIDEVDNNAKSCKMII